MAQRPKLFEEVPEADLSRFTPKAIGRLQPDPHWRR
jgi:hypothetical protein